MTALQKSILDSVLALPEPERVELVHAVLDSLTSVDELEDDALVLELQQRLDESRKNPQAALPWSQVKQIR